MKAILIAAGRSLRMKPISDKNFLKFCGKPLIEWQIDEIKKAGFSQTIVVAGNHNFQKIKRLSRSVRVVEQKKLEDGMAGAVLTLKSIIKEDEPVLLISSNDILDPKIFKEIRKYAGRTTLEGIILAQKVKKYFPGGYIATDRRGFIKKIIEKPGEGREPSDLVNIVVHLHFKPTVLFSYLERGLERGRFSKLERGRFSLENRPLNRPLKDGHYESSLQKWISHGARFKVLKYDGFWQPLKYPWHIFNLMRYFILKNFKGKKLSKGCQIAKSAKITGEVILDSGVKVLDNAVIQGPCYIGKNSIIATNALVRESHIGNNSTIGFCSEIARSYIGDNVSVHTSYIGDSVIGNDVNFGAGTAIGNLRFDEKEILVNIQDKKVNSGLKKLGIITGDHIRIGINTSFMPGRKVGSNSFVAPASVVSEDIPDNTFKKNHHAG